MNHATMDFETYSAAGYEYDETRGKWVSIVNSAPHGLGAVGASVYTEHPSAEVLSFAYDIHHDGVGPRLWLPGFPPPADLFAHIAAGGLCHAANSMFEFLVWQNICTSRMGWPALPLSQLRDTLAKSRAYSLPGSLGALADVLKTDVRKGKDGARLITKFCKPRNPTKHNPSLRLIPADDPIDGPKFWEYNVDDVRSEALADEKLPELDPSELSMWLLDQEINARGVRIDVESVERLWAFVQEYLEGMTADMTRLTGGLVSKPSEVAKIKAWAETRGVHMQDVTADTVDALLKTKLPDDVRRVLTVRSVAGSASVKKLPAILRRVSADGRLRDLFAYHSAHTGRWAGRGPQPQNLPSSGPDVIPCGCGTYFAEGSDYCPMCAAHVSMSPAPIEWNINSVESILSCLDLLPIMFPDDPLAAVSGCLRGMFIASPGTRLMCSDYSAIEAVVLAALAGEEWRLEVFRTHGKIYEMSASKISGVPFEDMMAHKRDTGEHHPLRKKIGKVAELASGYQGGLGAWKAFGADEFMTEDEIRDAIKKWRAESPAIVAFWYGVQDAAVAAALNPGQCFQFRDLMFGVDKMGALRIRLPSGRCLTYHDIQAIPDVTPWGKPTHILEFKAVDSVTKKWGFHETYGGKLTENIVQAAARDIMAHAIKNLCAAGYPVVLHVHDETVAEVPNGFGSVEEFERIMAEVPPWAAGWPIRAAGGWEGRRYRKD